MPSAWKGLACRASKGTTIQYINTLKKYIWFKYQREKDYNLFAKYYDISENGNWEGKNILIEKSIKPTKEENEKLKQIKDKLLAVREKRPKPFFDDKTQIDLNAYWISTLIFVAEVFNKEEWKKLLSAQIPEI